MAGFEEQLRRDIAESLRVDKERIELIGIQKRGPESRWELDLNILKCSEPGERVALDLGNELISQATDRYSELRSRPTTAAITGALHAKPVLRPVSAASFALIYSVAA